MINLQKAIQLAQEYKEKEFEKNYELLAYDELSGAYIFLCAARDSISDGYVITVNKDNGVISKKIIIEFFKQTQGYDIDFKELPNQEKVVANLFGF